MVQPREMLKRKIKLRIEHLIKADEESKCIQEILFIMQIKQHKQSPVFCN